MPLGDMELLQRFLETMPDAVLVVDGDGTIRLSNGLAAHLFGYSTRELDGQRLDALMPAGSHDRHEEHVRDFVETPRVRTMGEGRNLSARRKGGAEFPVDIALSPFTALGPKMVVASVRDATSLRASERRAVEQERQLNDVMRLARVGAWSLDLDSGTVSLSPSFLALLGLPADAPNEAALAGFHPEDLRRWREARDLSVATGSPATHSLRHRQGGGPWRTLEIRGSVEGFGAPGARLVGLAIDVTERIEAEALRQKTQEQLVQTERMATLGMLAAGLAHEMNNPLSVVLSNVDLLMGAVRTLNSGGDAGGPAGPLRDLQEELLDVREAATRLRDLSLDLRIFSRPETLSVEHVDVVRVVESSLRMANNHLRYRAQLRRELSPVAPIVGTEARLGQVVLNLLVNAAQAIPEGHPKTNEIAVSTGEDPTGHVLIEVSDTGTGLTPEHRERLFTPFFTTKAPGQGTGLGLSISRRIVEELGGTLEAENRPERGATFRVRLPRSTTADVQLASAWHNTPPPARKGRVLVLDDDETVARSFHRVLASAHEVVLFSSPLQALAELARNAHFDVILCDVTMPDMSGLDWLAAAARIAPELARRVVFVTGGALSEDVNAALDRLPNRRLLKPIGGTELRQVVAAFLQ